MHTHSDINNVPTVHVDIDEILEVAMHYFIHIHAYSTDPVHLAGLALLWLFVGAEVCTHLLCVCVISLRQTPALKGARLQTLHWDETPATGLRPEPWRTNTHRWRGHSYHGQSRHSQLLPKKYDIQVLLYHLKPFCHLDLCISCGVWILCPCVAIRPNWLVLMAHRWGTFDSSNNSVHNTPSKEGKISTYPCLEVYLWASVVRVSHLNLANAQARGGCVLNAQCSKECLSCRGSACQIRAG